MSWSSEISKAVLTVYANGVYDEASNEAAVSFFLGEREYSDCDSNELLPTRLEPFDDLLAGYWAIARALSCTPSPAFLTIYSGNEVCISNLNLSLKNKNSSHKHTHRTLTARILTRIQARVRSGGTVTLKYVDPKSGAEDDCSTNVRKAGTMAQLTIMNFVGKESKKSGGISSEQGSEEPRSDDSLASTVK